MSSDPVVPSYPTDLILPGQDSQDPREPAAIAPGTYYYRNPRTGVICHFTAPHDEDTIRRLLTDGYQPSSLEAERAQAEVLLRMQNRPAPPWVLAREEAEALEAAARAEEEQSQTVQGAQSVTVHRPAEAATIQHEPDQKKSGR